MLTSIAVENLQHKFHGEATIGFAYIYFNYRRADEQKIDNILSSILKQLCQSLAWIPADLKELYDQHQKYRTRPSLRNIMNTLHAICGLNTRVFVIVDALDECHDINGSRERFLSELFNLQANCAVNREDVERYVEGRIEGLSSFVRQNSQLREDIRTGISEAADGMFLLANFYMVSRCAGLVIVDVESDIIRLAHYTTQEYSEESQKIWFPNAEAETTGSCVTLLSYHEFRSGFCQTGEELEMRLRTNGR
ncbi:uncharacterized protein A1O9_00695 [Exophiala aquamarina CBS 119918]|uniref:Nephrocystin 3-like N-terminal domain-containing protein n=1 Tax=Exophiala aquamarina CBS 119918 TaxID=1182545 RepID=A0A072PSJ0_9EURO|nr:uncharacterized protein A1O9_00695 [Exophiala aquamarina CBS 119918]KEF62722.1 hypothetical protein A1O9_00695 [Exophiala aquamarina CBS 119918]